MKRLFYTFLIIICVVAICLFLYTRCNSISDELIIRNSSNSATDLTTIRSAKLVSEDAKIKLPTVTSQVSGDVVHKISFTEYRNNIPEFKVAWNKSLRRFVLKRYGDLRTRLNIDNATARKLEDLLVDDYSCVYDVQELALAKGLKPEQVKGIVKAAEADTQASIRALLSQEKYEELNIIPDKLIIEQDISNRMSVDFRSAGAELSPEQVQKLAAIIFAEEAKLNGDIESEAVQGNSLKFHESCILEKAVGILTDQQIEILKDQYVSENLKRYYGSRYRKN